MICSLGQHDFQLVLDNVRNTDYTNFCFFYDGKFNGTEYVYEDVKNCVILHLVWTIMNVI